MEINKQEKNTEWDSIYSNPLFLFPFHSDFFKRDQNSLFSNPVSFKETLFENTSRASFFQKFSAQKEVEYV